LRNTSKIKYEWTVSVSNNSDLVHPFFPKIFYLRNKTIRFFWFQQRCAHNKQ
jgi:hypothetical protein